MSLQRMEFDTEYEIVIASRTPPHTKYTIYRPIFGKRICGKYGEDNVQDFYHTFIGDSSFRREHYKEVEIALLTAETIQKHIPTFIILLAAIKQDIKNELGVHKSKEIDALFDQYQKFFDLVLNGNKNTRLQPRIDFIRKYYNPLRLSKLSIEERQDIIREIKQKFTKEVLKEFLGCCPLIEGSNKNKITLKEALLAIESDTRDQAMQQSCTVVAVVATAEAGTAEVGHNMLEKYNTVPSPERVGTIIQIFMQLHRHLTEKLTSISRLLEPTKAIIESASKSQYIETKDVVDQLESIRYLFKAIEPEKYNQSLKELQSLITIELDYQRSLLSETLDEQQSVEVKQCSQTPTCQHLTKLHTIVICVPEGLRTILKLSNELFQLMNNPDVNVKKNPKPFLDKIEELNKYIEKLQDEHIAEGLKLTELQTQEDVRPKRSFIVSITTGTPLQTLDQTH